ncbi:hypothetical protein RRG08_022373 [Elysia crispata]|uniref:Uncharacterized protein n=1 Tax=Elysia crispata TaxID=231223 RepID=A0AAE1D894_9GAST|nr:hypothetical protein RRG08_022373 [Elysia crispata]
MATGRPPHPPLVKDKVSTDNKEWSSTNCSSLSDIEHQTKLRSKRYDQPLTRLIWQQRHLAQIVDQTRPDQRETANLLRLDSRPDQTRPERNGQPVETSQKLGYVTTFLRYVAVGESLISRHRELQSSQILDLPRSLSPAPISARLFLS